MKYVLYCSLLVVSFCLTDCQKDKLRLKGEDTLIFGKYHGFCMGDCFHAYLLTNDDLYQDNEERYTEQELTFKATPLSEDEAELAQSLRDNFPEELLQTEETFIGCPDCHDQGGYYLETRQNGEVKIWRIDTDLDDLPDFLKDYAQQIGEVIDALRQ